MDLALRAPPCVSAARVGVGGAVRGPTHLTGPDHTPGLLKRVRVLEMSGPAEPSDISVVGIGADLAAGATAGVVVSPVAEALRRDRDSALPVRQLGTTRGSLCICRPLGRRARLLGPVYGEGRPRGPPPAHSPFAMASPRWPPRGPGRVTARV